MMQTRHRTALARSGARQSARLRPRGHEWGDRRRNRSEFDDIRCKQVENGLRNSVPGIHLLDRQKTRPRSGRPIKHGAHRSIVRVDAPTEDADIFGVSIRRAVVTNDRGADIKLAYGGRTGVRLHIQTGMTQQALPESAPADKIGVLLALDSVGPSEARYRFSRTAFSPTSPFAPGSDSATYCSA